MEGNDKPPYAAVDMGRRAPLYPLVYSGFTDEISDPP